MQDVGKQIDAIQAGAVLEPKFVDDMLVSLDQLGKDMQQIKEALALQKPPYPPPPPPIGLAIHFGQQKYTQIPVPILAIVVCPHNFDRVNAAAEAKAAMVADDRARCTAQADAFAAGVPSAHVVRFPNADHYVFNSNQADVIREMNDFLGKLQ
jgi:non-heme chloroperoxidase